MKKIYFTFFVLLGLLFAGHILAEELINNFEITIYINKDSTINVQEKIEYDFGNLQKHGIYRDITREYQAHGGNYNLRITDIYVADEHGNSYNFTTSNTGKYKRIKIGDGDKYVSGVKIYIINYKVKRAINFFENHDELYWNATGNEWEVPIINSQAIIYLPVSIEEDLVQKQCFAGSYGSEFSCNSVKFNYEIPGMVKGIEFRQRSFSAQEGLTIVVGLPKGIIKEPTIFAKTMDIIIDNWILSLPILTLIVIYYLWYTRGRDPRGRGTIIAQFDSPDNLTPAEVGTIIDEKAHKRDISAEIINLAIKGYLKITHIKKDKIIFKSSDYLLEKLKSESDLKNNYEKKVMSSLFKKKNITKTIEDLKTALKNQGEIKENSLIYKTIIGLANMGSNLSKQDTVERENKNVVKLSNLTNSFYKDLEEIKKQVYKSAVDKGYFPKNPNKVRGIYIGIGIAVIVLSWFIGPVYDFLGVISGAISGLIIIIFSFIMPVKSRKGVLAKEHILGLKEYLRVAEKDRIKFHNTPEKNPQLFEKLLPFAMVLKVEKEWAKQFEDIYRQQPNWYSNLNNSHFTAFALTNSLNGFQAKANTTLASRPSSAASGGSGFSGGGFSGGGFGGGGGGSW